MRTKKIETYTLAPQDAADAVPEGGEVGPQSVSAASVVCYEGTVPSFTESELNRLYGSIFSSLTHLKLYPTFKDVNTYVVREDKQVRCVLLFRRVDDRVQVLNEVVALPEEEIDCFLRYVFNTYRWVNGVTFHAIAAPRLKLSWPLQHYTCNEDIVLSLPPCEDDYRASLRKSSRQYINRYLGRLRREEPSFSFEVLDGRNADEELIRKVIDLNRARMREKQTESVIDEAEAQRIIERVKVYGVVGVVRLRGEVVAGTINYQVGKNFFLELVAHDIAFNHLRVGTLCCYLTICDCIARGGKEYHFLWGQSEYKYRLGGLERGLEHVEVYRSRTQYLLHSGRLLTNALNAREHQFRRWLHRVEQGKSGWSYGIWAACNAFRRFRASVKSVMNKSLSRA